MDERELHGKEFFSWEEFSLFFDSWREQTQSLFCTMTSIPLSKCKWASEPPRPEVADALKYKYIMLVCKEISVSTKKKDPRAQKMHSTEQDKAPGGCPARMVLKLNKEKDRLVITECRLTHNHSLCPIEFAYYFKRGRLMDNSCLPVCITNKISKQFVGVQDIRYMLKKCKTRENGVQDTLNALNSLFTNDPGAKLKLVFVENKVIIKTVFLLTSMMRSLCQRFPLALFFDRVEGFNEAFDLYTVLCVDANKRGRECGYCLAQKGTPNMLRFTLVSLLQSVPDIKFKVQCITLGVDIRELEVVEELLPQARVKLCRTQVLEVLFSKAQEMGAPEDERVWPILCKVADAESLVAHTKAVERMDSLLPQDFMKYYREHWHPCSKMWVKFWAFQPPWEIDANELIKQHKQKMLVGFNPFRTLAQCILDLVIIRTPKEEVKNLNEDEVATRYHSICNPESASLIEEELSFARHGSYNIRETTEGFLLNDDVSEFCMDLSLASCSCSIYTSSLLPCRHLFATRLHTGEPLFDVSLLRKNKMALMTISEEQ
ncbi:uncharacterized protein ZSWIM9-like [Rhinatrema bivittatum]|uniref:uncharacterized protein ZSWIM9-like n=1 Tax=Rhinatrema bivittatum TaxID=194408 RepID=UPI00112B8201|nr:uncharacterized protein ZSWIM9-like [Rhinatrema bivittatum]XP_029441129.1 uncharacterized protein ZSWIM9-like [Rhinatrema bivittatum]XP_029441130.1 uncharacterized protein ZSWIM9-like [Rhinatrema bivittatum]